MKTFEVNFKDAGADNSKNYGIYEDYNLFLVLGKSLANLVINEAKNCSFEFTLMLHTDTQIWTIKGIE